MKLKRSLHVALLGAVLVTRALAQTEADIASLLPKAQRGNAIAQYNLGLAYLNGKGVAADPIEAYVWLSLAHEGGFRGKALGVAAGGLEPTDFDLARKRLAERRTSLNLKSAPAKADTAEPDAKDIPVVRTNVPPAPVTASAAVAPAPNPASSQELAAAVADKQQLSSELAKAWSESEELKKQLTETQAAADFLTAETSKLHGERDTLTAKLAELAKEVASLRSDRDGARSLGVQAEAAVSQANAQRTALEASLKELQNSTATDKKWLSDELTKSFQEVTTLKAQLDAATKNIAAAPTAPAYPDLSGKVKELEASLAAVSSTAGAAKEEATRLADERIAREKQLLAVQQQASESAAAHVALQQEVQTLRRAAAAPTTPVAPPYPDLREQTAALESQVATLKTEASQSREQIAALTLAKLAAEKSLTQLPAAPAYPDLSAKVKELEASVAGLSAKATAAQQEATRLADERIEREKQLLGVQQQSADLATAHAALQQEVQTLRQAAAAPVAPAYPDLRGQVTSLETQLAAAKTEAERQSTALAQAQAAAEKPVAPAPTAPSYPDLSGKVRELESNLAAQTDAAEKSRTALQALQAASAQPAAPAYPDLSTKVQELEAALAVRSTEAGAVTKTAEELRLAKTATEQKLAAAEQSRSELTQQFEEFKRSALQNQREHLNRHAQVQMLESEKAALRQQSSADQTRLADLSAQLAASRRKVDEVYPTAPAYPDQRARVEQLETELTKTNEQANTMVTLLNRSQQEAKEASDEIEKLRAANRELETRIAATPAASQNTAPAYPDLREQVTTLEADLSAAKSAAPAYPDLREQVGNLEVQLEAARALPKLVVTEAQFTALKQELAETKEKLATTLHGYGLIEKERDALAARPAPVAAPDQSGRVRELEAQLAAKSAPVAPDYPDLRKQVASLEAAVSAAQSAAPAYPDLREQVSNLEIQLDAARALPKNHISPKEFADLKQELTDTQEKLATTLRGYSLMQKERDELTAKPDRVGSTQSDVARLTEAYNTLQRVNAQNERDLVLLRAQVQSAPGATVAITPPSATPKTAPVPVATRVVPAPAAASAPVVSAAPAAGRRTHIVVAGDTLVKISQRYYGNTTSWQQIYNANRELLGPNGTLKVGTELRIP